MRKLYLALIAAAIVAMTACPRLAAQSDAPSGSVTTLSELSSGGGQSGGADLTSGDPSVGVSLLTGGLSGQTNGSDQASSGAQRNTSSQPIGAGLPSGTDEEGPIQKHSSEFEVYGGGGAAPASTTKGDGVLTVGVRYGLVMTKPFMPGPLRGYFESAWDVMPVFEVYQPHGAVYGFAVDTIDLKWVYDVHRRVVPYWEFTGGLLFSRHAVPELPYGSTAFNFLPQAAAGVHIFSGRYVWSAEIRLLHISNDGIREPNDGITTIQGRISFGAFRPPHHKEK